MTRELGYIRILETSGSAPREGHNACKATSEAQAPEHPFMQVAADSAPRESQNACKSRGNAILSQGILFAITLNHSMEFEMEDCTLIVKYFCDSFCVLSSIQSYI